MLNIKFFGYHPVFNELIMYDEHEDQKKLSEQDLMKVSQIQQEISDIMASEFLHTCRLLGDADSRRQEEADPKSI